MGSDLDYLVCGKVGSVLGTVTELLEASNHRKVELEDKPA